MLEAMYTVLRRTQVDVFVIIGFLLMFVTGVFIARGKEDALVTLNLVPGETVYGEKRISVDVSDVCLYEYVQLKQYPNGIPCIHMYV